MSSNPKRQENRAGQSREGTFVNYAASLVDDYETRYPQPVAAPEAGLAESLQFFSFNEIDSRKISSQNLLERLNKEIRRRNKVVGIFPSMDSYVRLVTSYLIEYSEDWSSERSYIHPKIITEIQQKLDAAAYPSWSADGFCEHYLTLSIFYQNLALKVIAQCYADKTCIV